MMLYWEEIGSPKGTAFELPDLVGEARLSLPTEGRRPKEASILLTMAVCYPKNGMISDFSEF